MEERNMKKIFISLAAIAALVSCVEEKGLEPQPQQPVGNQVTIKAVAAETKTALGQDGTSVLWEKDDQIKVVLESKVQYEEVVEDFSVSGELNGSSANFTGEFDTTVEVEEGVHPYAVYPASAVLYDEATGNVSITHTLPEVQNGTIEPGMMLSSAILSTEAMESGTSTATFHNALTLLKIIVPEGVKSVSLTSGNGNLVGKVTATAEFTDLFNTYVGDVHYDVLPATGKLKLSKSGTNNNTVTLSNDGNALEAGSHYVLVYPGYVGLLTLNLEGTDGAELQASLPEITFNASEYRTINLSSIFNIGVEATEYISPLGGDVTVPIVSTEQYDYNVTIAGSWLTYEKTKALNSQEFTFSAGENATGAVREATVTISWTGGSKTFKASQNGYEPKLLNDYSESYKYDGTTYSGNLKIEISDDFSRGTYKVSGFLNTTTLSGQFSYTFYADYAGKTLTLKGPSVSSSYGAHNTSVILKVSDDYKTISMDDQKIGYADITDYQANIKENVSGGVLSKIAGIYSETWTYCGGGLVGSSGTLNLELDNGTLKVVQLCGLNITGMTAEYNEETGQLVTKGGQYESFGPVDIQSITFDVTISETSVTIVPNGMGGDLYIMNGYTTAYAGQYKATRNI